MLSCEWNCPDVLRYVVAKTRGDINRDVRDAGAPLARAVANGRPELARILLEAGANPNAGRAIVSSVTRQEPGRLACLKLLLEYSAEVNKLYAMFGSKEAVRTVLDFAAGNEEATKLLRAAGAMTAAEALRENPDAEIEGVSQ